MRKIIVVIIGFLILANSSAQEPIMKNGFGFDFITPNFFGKDKVLKKVEFAAAESSFEPDMKRYIPKIKPGFRLNYKKMVVSRGKYSAYLELYFTKKSNFLKFELEAGRYDFDYEVGMKDRILGLGYINEMQIGKKLAVCLGLGIGRNSFKFEEAVGAEISRDLVKNDIEKFKIVQFDSYCGLRYKPYSHLSLRSHLHYSTNFKDSIERNGFYTRYYERDGYYWMYSPPIVYKLDLSALYLSFGISYDF